MALRGVNLEIGRGDIFGIIGMSGAGKSTLLRCLCLLEKPSEGQILLNGRDLAALSGADLRMARRQMGVVFQGYNLLMQKTVAEDKGDHWVLNGSKIFITNAGFANVFVVFAMTDKSLGTKGISAFIVERDFPGFKVGSHEKKMGIRGSSTCELVFEDCIVPKENLLGEVGKGFKIAMTTLDGGRIGIGAQALGIAQAAIDECVKYTKERVQFGKRISQFQNTQFQLADMQAKLDGARLLIYRAAQAKHQLNGFFQPVTPGFNKFQFMKSGTFLFMNTIFRYILNLVDQILFYPFGTSLQQDIFFSVLNVYRPRSSVETDPSPVP